MSCPASSCMDILKGHNPPGSGYFWMGFTDTKTQNLYFDDFNTDTKKKHSKLYSSSLGTGSVQWNIGTSHIRILISMGFFLRLVPSELSLNPSSVYVEVGVDWGSADWFNDAKGPMIRASDGSIL
ncbi:MAG: hypothetical protein VYA34_08125 [Myxococcota bacterium]|nr:hypothetical protein [Myxococcota bacterium]